MDGRAGIAKRRAARQRTARMPPADPHSVTRPAEIEPLSNLWLVHRVSDSLLPAAVRAGVHPNAVTGAGLAAGLLAGLAYTQWRDPWFCLLGLLLMIAWHVADGLDGALARATGKASPLGRLLDGVADYSTFVAVYMALALTQARPLPMLALAVASGAFHAVQSAFYEAERATYIRRLKGQWRAAPRSAAGGALERLYNRIEAALGHATRPFDRMMAALPADERAALLARWRADAAPRLRTLTWLSANARTGGLFAAAALGVPWLFWLWEIVALTLLALIAGRRLRAVEARLLAEHAAMRG